MPQSVTVEMEIPAELYHSLQDHINSLDEQEQTRLQSTPYPHDRTAQWLVENAICSRRNVPETIGTEVEIEESGKISVVSSGGLLG